MIYSCPEGKGTGGLLSPIPHKKVPDLTYPPPQFTFSFSNSAWVLLRPTEISTFKELCAVVYTLDTKSFMYPE